MMIRAITALVLLLAVVPFAVGLFCLHLAHRSDRRMAQTLLFGYIGMLALLELVGIPAVLFFVYNGYTIFCLSFALIVGIPAALGIYWTVCKKEERGRLLNGIKALPRSFRDLSIEAKVFAVLLFLLLLFQLVMSFRLSSYDADDFYYNAQALSAQSFGTLYRVDESTGRSIPLDIRHGLALFPIWQAFLSTLSGLHVAIIAHRVMPLVLIPLSYLLVYEIARELFPEKAEQRLAFTVLMNVWRLFGHVSYFTAETFFFTRTWQGKSFAGNFILPAIVWIFLMIFCTEHEKPRFLWWVLSLLILASGSSSSLVVLLAIFLSCVLALLFAIRERQIRILFRTAACCIPGICYILIYVVN